MVEDEKKQAASKSGDSSNSSKSILSSVSDSVAGDASPSEEDKNINFDGKALKDHRRSISASQNIDGSDKLSCSARNIRSDTEKPPRPSSLMIDNEN